MTKKPATQTAVPRLFDAVRDIVQGTRQAIGKTAGDSHNAALHIPVHFAGTDMRVTIEAGPGIAALNAIQGAEMKASGKPPAGATGTISEAMMLLALHAAELRADNLELQDVHPQGAEWTDAEDQKTFEATLRVIRSLDALKGRLKAQGVES